VKWLAIMNGIAPLNNGLNVTILHNSVTCTSTTTAVVYIIQQHTYHSVASLLTLPAVLNKTVSVFVTEKGTDL